jgi:hypothetical protein
MKQKIKLISIKPLKTGNKKYEAKFEITKPNGKKTKRSTKFGAKGMSDFTKHKEIKRRNNYISRHKKDLRTKDPSRAGYLSMYILWNKKTFKASLLDYKRRLNIYNRSGKFPTNIKGSINKFGNDTISSLIKNSDLINKFGVYSVPKNVNNPTLYIKIKEKIKKNVKKKNRRWGAYDSGRLVIEYKKSGGTYSGKSSVKKPSKLDRWYKEKWIDACAWPKKKPCGRKSIKSKVTYCRPSKIINKNTPKTVQELSKKEIKKNV